MHHRIATSFVIIIVLLFFYGCGSSLQVTFYSYPPGALLYQGNQMIGYTPQTLYYNVTKTARKGGYMRVQGTKVVWASGATAEMPFFHVDLNRNGLYQQFTFQRPEEVPGRETDIQFSLELERLKMLKRLVNAAEAQAAQEQWNTLLLQIQQMQQSSNHHSNRHNKTECKSTLIGDTVYTTCE